MALHDDSDDALSGTEVDESLMEDEKSWHPTKEVEKTDVPATVQVIQVDDRHFPPTGHYRLDAAAQTKVGQPRSFRLLKKLLPAGRRLHRRRPALASSPAFSFATRKYLPAQKAIGDNAVASS